MVRAYVRRFPFETDGKVYPEERERYIASSRHPKRREESFHVWKLLEQLISDSTGRDMSSYPISRKGYKWSVEGLEISLSHTGNHAAAIVSDAVKVGIDIEFVSERFTDRMAERVLYKDARETYRSITDDNEKRRFLCMYWTGLEAIFKATGKDRKRRDISEYLPFLRTFYADTGDGTLICSVYSEEETTPILITDGDKVPLTLCRK